MSRFFVLIMIVCISSCSWRPENGAFDEWMEDVGKIKVLCTIGMLEDLVSQVGGDRISSLTLINGQLDPHTYELVKGDDEKLQIADLIVCNGLGLEHGPSLRNYLDNCENCISVGDYIVERDSKAAIRLSGQLDPHIWTDVSLYARGIDAIVEALAEYDPPGTKVYQENGRILRSEMLATHKEMRRILQEIPSDDRFLVTSHDAFNYFSRAYLAEADEAYSNEWQKRFEAPEGLSPQSQLSPLDIQRIIDYLVRFEITVLFPESNVSQDSIRKILDAGEQSGLDLEIACVHLYADAMGKPGSDGDTYLKMMKHNAVTIAHYLNGINRSL